MIKISLYTYVCCLFFHLWRTAFISYAGIDPGPYFGLASVPVGLYSSYLMAKESGTGHIAQSFRLRLNLFCGIVLLSAVIGYVNDNRYRFILLDFAIFSTFFIGALIGTYERAWKILETPLGILVLISIPLTLLGVNRAELIISELGTAERNVVFNGRYGVETLAYRLYPALLASPILFAMNVSDNRFSPNKIISLFAVAVSIALTIFFWKRGPFAYLLSIVAFGSFLNFKSTRGGGGTLFLFVIAFTGAAVTLAGNENVYGLFTRYQSTLDNFGRERWEEPLFLFADFGPLDYLIGRGLGGWYDTPKWWAAGVSVVTNSGVIGRESIHAGILWPFIKGGIILFAVYHSFSIVSLKLKPNSWLSNRFNFCAATILPCYFFFSFFQNVPTMSTAVEVFTIGMCTGRYGIRCSDTTNSPLHNIKGRSRAATSTRHRERESAGIIAT